MKLKSILLAVIIVCLVISAAGLGILRYHPEILEDTGSASEQSDNAVQPTETVEQPEENAGQPEETVEPTEHDAAPSAQEILDSMTLEQKLYQLMYVRPEVLTGVKQAVRAGDSTKAALEATPVGGILYFAQNMQSTDQLHEMLTATQSYASEAGAAVPLFLGVDEEGGQVARVANTLNVTTKFDPMAVYGEQGDPEQAYSIGKTLATELGEIGFNMDFAPVADVLSNPNNTEIGNRSFGSDPELVSSMVKKEVAGLQENGMMAVLKHFPGHGSTETNSHEGTSVSDRTLEELTNSDLIPFEAGIEENAAFVLVSHMTAENLDTLPCSLSGKVITDILRKQLNYNGIVITDGLDMGAITDNYSTGEACVMAIQAGADVLLCPDSITEAYEALNAAVQNGSLSEERIDESVLRILTAKAEYGLIS